MEQRVTSQVYQVGGLSFELARKRVKNINLRIRPDGSVYVSAPARVPLSEIQRFVERKRDWIERRRATMRSRIAEVPAAWSTGDVMSLWGEALTIVQAEAPGPRKETVTRDESRLIIAVAPRWSGPDDPSVAHRRKLVHAWLIERLREAALPLFTHHEARMGVHASAVRFRTMKTRWGSCNTRTKTITLNTQLVQLPSDCLESVVVHELCHLLEPSHNARFHGLMDRFYPSWKEARKRLNAASPIGI